MLSQEVVANHLQRLRMDKPDRYTKLLALPAERLLDKFGAGGHKPGSGSAAALLSLIACKLLQTVISLTHGRKRYAGVTEQLTLANQDMLSRVEPSLFEAFQNDSIQFDQVIQLRRARDAEAKPEERRSLSRLHLRELEAATEIPLQIARDSISVAEHGLAVFDLGFRSARGDSGVAISAALSGASGALSVVFLNLTSFRGSRWAVQTREEADMLNARVQELQGEMVTRLLRLRTEAVAKEPSSDGQASTS